MSEIARIRADASITTRERERKIAALQGQLQAAGDDLMLMERALQSMPLEAEQDDDLTQAFYEGETADQSDEGDYALTVEMILAYDGNVADLLDDARLQEIGQSVVREYELDKASRHEWEEMAKEALKSATQKRPERKDTPYPGASNVKYPLLTTACIQFAARAYPAIVRGDEVIDAKVVGADPQGEKVKRAQRSAAFANDQLIYRATEWETGTDTLLHALPAIGHGFRKIYWDAHLGRVRLDFVSALDVIVPCDAPSLDLTPRITHELKKYPYEVQKLTRGETPLWKAHDYARDQGDTQKPCEYLEQVRYEDLDDDGLDEPYIVTVHKETGVVVRIDPAFDVDDIKVTQVIDFATGEPRDQIVSITRMLPWVDYGFLPDPEGNYYNMGFGQLLAPISAVIDTTINELIDAGHLANTNTGFLGGQVKTRSGEMTLHPNKFKQLPGANNVRDAIYRMEFPGPNQTLFALLEFLITTAKDITSVKDILTGEAPGSQPATSTLALIEQGLQVFSAIYKRIYRSMTREFELLYKLNARYLSIEDYNAFLDAQPPLAEINAGAAPTDVAPGQQAPMQDPSAGGQPPQMGQVLPFPSPAAAGGMAGAGGPLPGAPTPGMQQPAVGGFPQAAAPQPASQPAMPGMPPGMDAMGGGFDPSAVAPTTPPGAPDPNLQQALAAQMPQQPQQEIYDPAIDFNLKDVDIRPVADPTAVTEMQRLAKINFLLQFANDPLVDQAEIRKRAFEDSRMAEPEKLMAKPNPMQDQQAQASLSQIQGEARKVHAEAALLEAQAGGAQAEPGLRQAEMALKQQEAQGKASEAQIKQVEADLRRAEIAFREREIAIAERGNAREDERMALEARKIALEEARQMFEEYKADIDEAERGARLDLDGRKLDIEADRTTLERLRVLGDQKLGRDSTMIELRKIVADSDQRRADREQAAKDAKESRTLDAHKLRVQATLDAKKIDAQKDAAKANAKAKADSAANKKSTESSKSKTSDDAQRATAEALKGVAEAIKRSSGAKRIVRDEDGKIVGAEPIEE